jgi:hypothetical protein
VKKLMDEGLSTLKMYKKMLKFQAAKDGLDLSDWGDIEDEDWCSDGWPVFHLEDLDVDYCNYIHVCIKWEEN